MEPRRRRHLAAADEGRDRHYTWAVAPDPTTRTLVRLCEHRARSRPRPGGRAGSLYRWEGDGPWQRLDGGLPQPLSAMPYALVHAEGRLFAEPRTGGIFASADRGESWR